VVVPGCQQTYPVHYLATRSAAAFAEPLVVIILHSSFFVVSLLPGLGDSSAVQPACRVRPM